jgi:hypothetical protein
MMTCHSFSTDSDVMDEFLNRKDNKSEYLRRLVKADMQGPDTDMIGLEMQIQTLEKQAQSKAREEEMLQQQAEELRELKQSFEGQQEQTLEEARQELDETPKEPSNPAIQTWARKVDLSPEELCEQLE